MRLHHYPETDSLYIDLLNKPGVEAQEVRPGVVLDFDEHGALVGIDIDHAGRNRDLGSLETAALPVRDLALVG